MIICTVYIHKQLAYLEHKDLGFERNNIVIIPTGLWYGMEDFKQEIMKNPGILSATASMNSPVDFYWENRNVTWGGGNTDEQVTMSEAFVDEDFEETYGLEMVKGSFLSFRFEDYWKAGLDTAATASAFTVPVVINETAWKVMGFEDPIGQVINNRYLIVGVVRDFHFKPLKERIAPLLMTYNPEAIFSLSVKIREEDQSSTIAFIEETYNKFRPTRGFSYSYLDDDLRSKYASEQYQARLFLYFTLLSVLISCLGVLGLTGYSIKHRLRELTMRKVWGSTSAQILILFLKSYSKWVPVAFMIAFPLSWYFLHRWSMAFAYRADLSWWIFALSGLAAWLIAILTICFIGYRDANRNPAESIRYE
jgi:putative ABC transport system permease protein